MHPVGYQLGGTETLYAMIPIVVCGDLKMIVNGKIKFPNSKIEGSYSSRGEDRHSGTALLLFIITL